MIQSAKNYTLKNINSNLPNMESTIKNWFLDIEFKVLKKKQEGADWVNKIDRIVKTKGVVQPAKDTDLKFFSEGYRDWNYQKIHCLNNADFKLDELIEYDGIVYKVMAKKNYQKYGYIRYIVIETFTD